MNDYEEGGGMRTPRLVGGGVQSPQEQNDVAGGGVRSEVALGYNWQLQLLARAGIERALQKCASLSK